ncbi:MAG TPA: hypothetical protein VN704_04260 [Verrucomicrobiae bacterium]|nr:hypothetical protein [Verrucomicrobiae bacterium]
MSNIKNSLVVVSATLLILTIAATNIVQIKSVAFAQNFDVNQRIKEIQTQFPLLSQNTSVKDVIHKVQGLDKDQALKSLAAFHILRNLQEYQALGSTGVSTNGTG